MQFSFSTGGGAAHMSDVRDNQWVMASPALLVEPLVRSFPAWLQVVSPIPAALRLASAQLPMLESFLESPEEHFRAAQHPATRGGSFVGCPDDEVALVEKLYQELSGERALLELATDVRSLDSVLNSCTDGLDLAPVYTRLPSHLRGMVELTYDGYNRAGALYREDFLYRSEYSTRRRQTVHVTTLDGDDRPFMLSTPRFGNANAIVAEVPFCHPVMDTIARSRRQPVAYSDIVDGLGNDVPERVLRHFWTSSDTPPTRSRFDGPTRVRYFGHACLLIESPGSTVIIDPFISHRPAPGRFSLADLPDHIDYCLITHGHADHLVLETLLALRPLLGRIVVPANLRGEIFDPSLRLFLTEAGFTDVVEAHDYDSFALDDGEITALPFAGEHGDLRIAAKTTYTVRTGGRSIFAGADTRAIDPSLWAIVREQIGPIDEAFLGMECQGAPMTWMYSPLFPAPLDRKMSLSRRLNGSDAVEAAGLVKALGAKRACIYALGEEPWLQHVMATNYTPESYQLRQVQQFQTWCANEGVEFHHLYGQAELGATSS